MSNFKGSNMKIKLMAILLLAIVVLSSLFVQGCIRSCEYIDPEAFQELINRHQKLVNERDKLQQQVDEQSQAIAALQAQKSDLKTETQVVNADITSAKGEVDNLQQQSVNNQAELGNVDNQVKDKQAETDKAEERIRELDNQIEQLEEQIGAILSFSWCFDGDTLVLMADNSMKKIKDVEAGEAVLAYDMAADTIAAAEVTATTNGEASYYYLINGNLKVVPPHPFLTAEGQWVAVEDLKAGDMIRSNSGMTEITSIELVDSGLEIFNIFVEDYHNFYVSADGKDFYLVREQ